MPVPGNDRKEESLLGIICGPGRRPALLVGLVVTFVAAMAGKASATVQITNQNDPAGDPTVVSYRLTPPPGQGAPIDFALHDTEYKGFGPFAGQVVVQVVLPAGWRVEHIRCWGFNLNNNPTAANEFQVDEANGTVTMQHAVDDEQFCTFTNGRVSSDGSSGVSPALPPNLGVALPTEAALLGVRVRRGHAVATVRLIRRSVVTSRLRRGGRVVGRSRAVRKAGTYDFTVSIGAKAKRAFQRQGRKRVALQLRVVVVETRTKAKHLFRFQVLVPV
jgi:hypothetical protein